MNKFTLSTSANMLLLIFAMALSSCKIVTGQQEETLADSLSGAMINEDKDKDSDGIPDSLEDENKDGIPDNFFAYSNNFHENVQNSLENMKGSISNHSLTGFDQTPISRVTLKELAKNKFVIAVSGQLNYFEIDLSKLLISTSLGTFKLIDDFSGAGRFHWLFEKNGEYIEILLYSLSSEGIDGSMTLYLLD